MDDNDRIADRPDLGPFGGGDDLEIIDRSGRYALTLGPDGHAIWDLDAPADAAPVATFPSGDDGFDAAWARYGQLLKEGRKSNAWVVKGLRIAVIVSATVWIVAGSVFTLQLIFGSRRFADAAFTWQWLTLWGQYLTIAFSAILIAIWVGRRLIEERTPSGPPPRPMPASSDRGSGLPSP